MAEFHRNIKILLKEYAVSNVSFFLVYKAFFFLLNWFTDFFFLEIGSVGQKKKKKEKITYDLPKLKNNNNFQNALPPSSVFL